LNHKNNKTTLKALQPTVEWGQRLRECDNNWAYFEEWHKRVFVFRNRGPAHSIACHLGTNFAHAAAAAQRGGEKRGAETKGVLSVRG